MRTAHARYGLLAHAQDPPNLTYLLDIIEQGGEHMVRSAYWDCGDWSDLWQACRVSVVVCAWHAVVEYTSSNVIMVYSSGTWSGAICGKRAG